MTGKGEKDKRLKGKKVLAPFPFLLLCANQLFALPIYRSMVSTRNKALVNCTLCHQVESWELNKYGSDFLKEGRSFQALETLDGLDSDQDGFVSGEEFKAGSNPGDPASTPQKAGNWLKEAKPTFPPKKVLAPLFPGAITYRVQENPLPDQLLTEIEKFLGKKLRDEEKVPTLFIVEQNKKLVGLAAYAVSPTKDKGVHVLLVVTNGNKIIKVHPQHVHSKALGRKTFLEQFLNKGHAELSQVQPLTELKKESEEVINSVRRTLVVLERLVQ